MQIVPKRRSAPWFGVLAVIAALCAAAPASADTTQSCRGATTAIVPKGDRDTGLQYAFACRQPITAFTLVSSAPVAAFDVSADVFDPVSAGGALRGDDRLGTCEGSLPGLGFSCAGTYSGQRRVVRATYDLVASPCTRDARSRRVTLRSWLVVAGTDGKLSGPYALGKPQGCKKRAFKRLATPRR